MNLNLGCGPGEIRNLDFVHIDASRKLLFRKLGISNKIINIFSENKLYWDLGVQYKNILKMDFSKLQIDHVYSSHFLEHIYFSDCNTLLSKLGKFQKQGSIIRLVLPDYDAFIDEYVKTKMKDPIEAFFDFEESLIGFPLYRPRIGEILRTKISGDLHVHKWHPTYFVVEKMLRDSGYSKIEKLDFQLSNIPGIKDLEVYHANSFYIEAIK